MPREKTILYGRAYRQFCPLTSMTVFKEEHTLICAPLTLFRVFETVVVAPTIAPTPGPSTTPIPKPPGEVARPKRGGYNLEQAIQLPPSDYESIRVSIFFLGSLFDVPEGRALRWTLSILCISATAF